MARPPSADSLLRNMTKKPISQPLTPIASEMFLPNHSGIARHPEAERTFVKKTDLLEDAYWDGNYNFPSAQTANGITRGVITYMTRFSGWTANHEENWAESGGEWTYSGDYGDTGARKFLVTYSYTLDAFSNHIWFSNVARLTKDVGAGHVEITGSVQICSQYAFVIVYGVYLERHTVSNSTIISMEDGDKLAFQTGWHCTGSGTFNIGGINTLIQGFPSPPVKGFHINITPIDLYK